jgi:hypothetical protein
LAADFFAADFFAVDFFAGARLAADFFAADFFAVDFFAGARLAVDFFAADFLAADFFAVDFFEVLFLAATMSMRFSPRLACRRRGRDLKVVGRCGRAHNPSRSGMDPSRVSKTVSKNHSGINDLQQPHPAQHTHRRRG